MTFASYGQTKQPVKKPTTAAKPIASKFGALAIDKSNGFYYGWSFDYSTLAEAEKKAIEECNKRGGKGTIVLSWSGEGCGVYRTVAGNSVNTAFGWGVAKTKEEADVIATRECLKRSNGKDASNYVWACNSTTKSVLKIIRNDIESFKPILKTYGVDENGTGYLKSGNKIILTTTKYRFKKELIPGELFLFQLRSDNDYYKYINPLCVVDKNGVQKDFGGELFFEEIESYLPYTINENEGTDFGFGLACVKDFYKKDNRFGASFHGDSFKEIEKAMSEWTGYLDGKDPDNFSTVYYDKLVLVDDFLNYKETRDGFYCFQQYRSADQRIYFKTEFNTFPIK